MSKHGQRAYHRTMLTLNGAVCAVREDRDQVMQRVREAVKDAGWFEVTSDPEGEAVWINAGQLQAVARERTPVERLHAEASI